MTTSSLEEMQAQRPAWVPRWMFSVPDAWVAFGAEHPLKVEELRDGDEFVVRAELPGIDPDRDVEITVEGDVLRLRGERRMHREEADQDRFRSEFSYGSFTRQLPVPPSTTEDDINASYEDGILEVRIPIGDEEPSAKRIPVTRG